MRVKSRRHRSRMFANIALLAASAAVVSAATLVGGAPVASPHGAATVTSGQVRLVASVRLADAAGRPPARRDAGAPKKQLQILGGQTGAETAALVGSAPPAAALCAALLPDESGGDWWLDFARAGSRTRGQPSADELA